MAHRLVSPGVCRSFARNLFVLLAAFWWSCAAHAGALWFSDADGIHRVDTDTNAVTQHVAQTGVVALVLDQKDGSLWALTASQLLKYDANGAALLSVDLKSLATSFNAGRRLALDPSDDSIWVAGGNDAFHLDAAGHGPAAIEANDVVQDIALAQDQSLWLLSRNTLSRYSPQGALLGSARLAGDMQQAAFLAIDDANSALWLAGAKSVFRVPLALPVQSGLAISTAEVASGLAIDSGTGTAWVAGQSSLFAFTKDGAAFAATSLAHQGLGNFQALAFDAQSQAVWLGHEKGLGRFNASGVPLATIPAAVKVGAISAAPSGIVPIVTIVSPPDGALTRNAFIPIRLHYDASCFGQPCNYPPSVFAAYVLTATLNGQAIGSAFVFDPATNDAVYTPTVRYAEGSNTFSAFVTDSSGRRSRTAMSRFTVDTVAPAFLNVTPASGSLFTSPNITLQGSIDDIMGRVVLESFSGAPFNGPNPAGASFSYAITLQPGTNSFRLTASDPAGNTNPLSLAYVFSTLTLTVTSPANGALIDDNKVTVTGTFSGATTATITVNGQAAVVTGTTFTAADVPLQPGANTITVIGTTPQGASDTKTLTVTSTAPSITITSPADGASVSGVSVLVTGRVQAPANSGVKVNHTTAAVDGSGNYFALVTLLEGANTLTATVTTPSGKSVSQSVSVTASGQPPSFSAKASPATGLAPLNVTVTVSNNTAQNATYTFFGSGPFALPASGQSVLTLTLPAGVFTPAVVVTDGSGVTTSQSLVIQVLDASQVDQQLRAIWAGMTSALASGDKAKAMSYLHSDAKAKYGPIFDALMPSFAGIVASFSPLAASSLNADVAEYVVKRTSSGASRAYFVYFVRGADGVWRLDEM